MKNKTNDAEVLKFFRESRESNTYAGGGETCSMELTVTGRPKRRCKGSGKARRQAKRARRKGERARRRARRKW